MHSGPEFGEACLLKPGESQNMSRMIAASLAEPDWSKYTSLSDKTKEFLFRSVFTGLNREILTLDKVANVGAVAIVGYFDPQTNQYIFAHVGNCLVIAVHVDQSGKCKSIERLNHDHDQLDAIEEQRVKDYPEGMFFNGYLGGVIKVTRAFGFSQLKYSGLIADPEVIHYNPSLQEGEQIYFILSTGGLRDSYSSATDKNIIEHIEKGLSSSLEDLAKQIADLGLLYGSGSFPLRNILVQVTKTSLPNKNNPYLLGIFNNIGGTGIVPEYLKGNFIKMFKEWLHSPDLAACEVMHDGNVKPVVFSNTKESSDDELNALVDEFEDIDPSVEESILDFENISFKVVKYAP